MCRKREEYMKNVKFDAYTENDYILTEEEMRKVERDGENMIELCTGENEYYINSDGMMQSKLTRMIKPPQPKNPITDEMRRKRWEATLDKKTLKSKKEELDLLWKQEEEKRLETIIFLNEREEREKQREIKRIRNIPKEMLIRQKREQLCAVRQRILEIEKKREEAERLRKEEEERKERREARKQFNIYRKFYKRKEDKEGEARREARRLERFINGESDESSSSDSEDYDESDDEYINDNKKKENDCINSKSNELKKNIRR